MGASTAEQQLRTYLEENITIDATVGGVRIPIASFVVTPPCKKIELFLETGQIRFTADGTTAPTTTVGEVMNPFDRMTIENMSDAENFRAIRTGAASGTLRARYKR